MQGTARQGRAGAGKGKAEARSSAKARLRPVSSYRGQAETESATPSDGLASTDDSSTAAAHLHLRVPYSLSSSSKTHLCVLRACLRYVIVEVVGSKSDQSEQVWTWESACSETRWGEAPRAGGPTVGGVGRKTRARETPPPPIQRGATLITRAAVSTHAPTSAGLQLEIYRDDSRAAHPSSGKWWGVQAVGKTACTSHCGYIQSPMS